MDKNIVMQHLILPAYDVSTTHADTFPYFYEFPFSTTTHHIHKHVKKKFDIKLPKHFVTRAVVATPSVNYGM